MISWRAQRQLIALLIVALPVVAVGFWAFSKFLPAPTCFDNRKNQEELDIDCGGPCAPCELRKPLPVSVFWARAVSVRKDTFGVAALIQNPNEVLSSGKLEYEFSLFDSLGAVARRTGSTFILPQERIYVIETNLKTTRIPERVEFRITKADWEFRQGERPSFAVERREYKVVEENGFKQSVVEASIANRSPFGFRKVGAAFLLFDSMGNVLGINQVAIEDFFSGSRRVVKSIWPEEIGGIVAVIEVEPRVNIFEDGAVLKPQ